MRKLLLSLFLLVGVGVAPAVLHAAVNTSPIVQLISYRSAYGNHVEMLGWGSASLITSDGVILSNNHVVDDGTGTLATAFSVCMTTPAQQRPVCDYTASLISRDESMDVSLLKIDPVDVHGKAVNYSQFKTVEVDYTYTPTVQDEVVIVGYPWVGADTITETKGIIGGSTEYNGYQYIKTDATIAGGNSGGAMLNKAGKLIGVPTFTMGGYSDSSLGYGLSIKEAQEFIEGHVNQAPLDVESSVNFASYQKTLDTINKNRAISDQLLTVALPGDYEVKNYIAHRYLELASTTQRDSALYSLSVELTPTPRLTDEKQFFRFLEAQSILMPDYERLLKKTIGGQTFYVPVYAGDTSQGDASYFTSYYAHPTENLMLNIQIVAPLGNANENLNKRIKAEIDQVLGSITFKPELSALNEQFRFQLKTPQVSIDRTENTIANDRAGYFVRFLDGLREYMSINIMWKDPYSGRNQTAEEIMEIEARDVSAEYKSIVTFQGVRGYIACTDSRGFTVGGYFYPNFMLNFISTDEKGITLPEQRRCSLKLVEGLEDRDGNEYIMEVLFVAPKDKISESVDTGLAYISEHMTINGGSGDTMLVNPYKDLISLAFTDLGPQKDDYKQMLRKLVEYGLLDNTPRFNPYQPMRWKDFLPVYLRAVYNVDLATVEGCTATYVPCQLSQATIETPEGTKNIGALLREMNINLYAFVPEDRLYTFHDVFFLRLAGVDLGNLSEKDIQERSPGVTSYYSSPDVSQDSVAKVQALTQFLYGKRRIEYGEVMGYDAAFIASKAVLLHPRIGLIEKELYLSTPQDFNTGDTNAYYRPFADGQKDRAERRAAAYKAFQDCVAGGASLQCVTQYALTIGQVMQEEQEAQETYIVLTKAAAYDFVMQFADFGFFDPELAKKKDVEVGE